MNSGVLIEAVIVGILVILIGTILHILSMKLYGKHDLNNMAIYAVHLFVVGIVTHLICEVTGMNKWYCKNGTACK